MTITTARTTTTPVAVAGTGLAAAVVAAGLTAYGAHNWAEIAVVGALIAITAAVVFGYVVPRALRRESSGRTALGLGIPALLLLVPAFWTGLPLVLGAAAVLVGNAGRRARTGSGTCIAGLVIGALAVVGYLASYGTDAMNGGGAGFLFG